jgi:hypothetical protein
VVNVRASGRTSNLMADERKKAAQLRLFRLAAIVQRDEGLKLDGEDPAWRALCNDPRLAQMSDDEIEARLVGLAQVVSDDAGEAPKDSRFKTAMRRVADGMIEAVERGDMSVVTGAVVVEDGAADEVQDETDSPAA